MSPKAVVFISTTIFATKTSFLPAHRFLSPPNRIPSIVPRCSQLPPQDPRHQHDPLPYYLTYTSWRNPTWISRLQSRPRPRPQPRSAPSKPLFVVPSEHLPLRLSLSALLTAFLALVTISYVRLNQSVQSQLSTVTQATLSRDVTFSRLVRFNPITGIRLNNVTLSPPPKSMPTAPRLSAKYLHAHLSSPTQALFTRSPLRLNLRLESPQIHVSQRVIIQSGLPVGQWDPGIHIQQNTPPIDAAPLKQLFRFLQPGQLSISDADLHMHPADFQDYGHGSETVHIPLANATATFPRLSVSSGSVQLDGQFRAEASGTPAEGGSINVNVSADAATLRTIQPEQVAATLRVSGENVRANRVAAFLNLPFRADQGLCSADMEMDFLYNSKSLVPEMRGEALLDAVALRFHPDPTTPAFHSIKGKLRFDGKKLFLDGPVGELGTLPMTVVGNIHLEDGYDLMGYVRSVDVNNIIESFDVEKFVPVEGLVKGEARMTGTLEEPIVTGHAESVGSSAVFDRLPVEKAKVAFKWDAIAGILNFSDISGTVKGGGSVVGNGSLYFDMTKDSPYGISKETHSSRSPKATYWNPGVVLEDIPPLLPEPSDELEIDEQAPYRPYDSMRFDFEVKDVNGGDLLDYYGGEYGAKATKSIGLVSAEAILAGNAKDSNCRVVWRSISPPPRIQLSGKPETEQKSIVESPTAIPISMPPQVDSETRSEKPTNAERGTKLQGGKETKESHPIADLDPRVKLSDSAAAKHRERQEQDLEEKKKDENEMKTTEARVDLKLSGDKATNSSNEAGTQADEDGNSNDFLGGGDFRGLVYIKLGDLPEARRVKVRTTIRNFDARRAGWTDPKLRTVLAHTPLLDTSMDTYFKGVMSQRPILPPGTTKMPRTPRMELLGIDGALAVRKLTVNNVKFDNIMNGSFSFSTSDVSLSLKESILAQAVEPPSDDDGQSAPNSEQNGSNRRGRIPDQLVFAASLKGEGNLRFKLGASEIIGSFTKDKNDHQMAALLTRNVAIQDFIGEDLTISSGETLAGLLNVDMNLDLTDRTGKGSLAIRSPRLGPLRFTSIGGTVLWQDRKLFLEGGTVKYRRSEYNIDASYFSREEPYSEFGWEVNVNIPSARVRDVARLIKSGNAVATAMQSPEDAFVRIGPTVPAGPAWFQKLSQSNGSANKDGIEHWEVPPELSFEDQMEWFNQYLEEQKNLEKRTRRVRKQPTELETAPSITDIQGDISGKVSLKYNSRYAEAKPSASNANALLQAILDQLARTTFSFDLSGNDWRVGSIPIEQVKAVGSFRDGVLDIGPFYFSGEDGFTAKLQGRITKAGAVEGNGVVQKAPANLVNRYSRAPVAVTGECNGRLEIDGSLSNPRVLGRAVWNDASMNGQHVRGAMTDLACVNGRCLLNVDAKIGGRRFRKERASSPEASLPWDESVIQDLKAMANRMSHKSEIPMAKFSKAERRDYGEPVRVLASAPVRFYLLKYLQRQTTSSLWTELEPVLGGSHPADDEWVLVDVDVKRYGLTFLNVVLPELGWNRGDSDIRLRVSGTLPNPVVKGKITVSDGRAWPTMLPQPLQGLRGEVQFSENGLMSFKSISGRCDGKNVNIYGDLFVSDGHREAVRQVAESEDRAGPQARPVLAREKRERRLRNERKAEAKSALQRGARGLIMEFGEVPVNLEGVVLSKLSGKVLVSGTGARPAIGGALTFSDGVVFLGGNANGTSRGRLPKTDSANALSSAALEEGLSSSLGAEVRQKDKKNGSQTKKKKKSSSRNVESSAASSTVESLVSLQGLRISFGRDMQIVYPFVLNIDTTGSVKLDGNMMKPQIEGEIKLLRGNVNLLAPRMAVRREAKNYVKFVKSEESEVVSGTDGLPEPLLHITLENRDALITIGECGVSRWSEHITLSNKRGDEITDGIWAEWVQSQFVGTKSREAIKRLVSNYVVNAMMVSNRTGAMEWKLFPAIVGKAGSFGNINLKEDLGIGGEIELGPLSIGTSRSISGESGHKIRLAWNWLGIELESEGKQHSAGIEIRLMENSGKGKEGSDGEKKDGQLIDEASRVVSDKVGDKEELKAEK